MLKLRHSSDEKRLRAELKGVKAGQESRLLRPTPLATKPLREVGVVGGQGL